MKHTSLKSRPGAGKRKEGVLAMERERFERNLAVMAAGGGVAGGAGLMGEKGRGKGDGKGDAEGGGGKGGGEGGGGGGSERWAAIRGFIGRNMEVR